MSYSFSFNVFPVNWIISFLGSVTIKLALFFNVNWLINSILGKSTLCVLPEPGGPFTIAFWSVSLM